MQEIDAQLNGLGRQLIHEVFVVEVQTQHSEKDQQTEAKLKGLPLQHGCFLNCHEDFLSEGSLLFYYTVLHKIFQRIHSDIVENL